MEISTSLEDDCRGKSAANERGMNRFRDRVMMLFTTRDCIISLCTCLLRSVNVS